MYDEFLKTDEAKQEKIINAALWEFAKKDYSRASTNRIVEEAGISKGILFHYFQNKIGLYEYLLDYSIGTMKPVIMNTVDFTEPDLFVRLKQVLKVKLQLTKRFPAMSEFLQKAVKDPPKELAEKITRLYSEAYKNDMALFSNYDKSRFKDSVPADKAFDIIFWTMLGYSNQILAEYNKPGKTIDYDEIFRRADEYLDILQQAFYK